jgi:hypothetical protein
MNEQHREFGRFFSLSLEDKLLYRERVAKRPNGRNELVSLFGSGYERFMHQYLKSVGYHSDLFEDIFDQRGDGKTQSFNYECKAEAPYMNKRAFTIEKKQLPKCSSNVCFCGAFPFYGRWYEKSAKYAGNYIIDWYAAKAAGELETYFLKKKEMVSVEFCSKYVQKFDELPQGLIESYWILTVSPYSEKYNG